MAYLQCYADYYNGCGNNFNHGNIIPNIVSEPNTRIISKHQWNKCKNQPDDYLYECSSEWYGGTSECAWMEYYGNCTNDPSKVMRFTVEYLTTNTFNINIDFDPRIIPVAINLDTNLLNPWDLIVLRDRILVANSGTNLISTYNLDGSISRVCNPVFPPGQFTNSVTVQSNPIALGVNNNLNAFVITNGLSSAPATILTATITGTINAFNASIFPTKTVVVIDRTDKDAVYTGMVVNNGIIYVADFYNGVIDTFSPDFVQLNNSSNYQFIDQFSGDAMPPDYAPYNIALIDNNLYVVYAKRNPTNPQLSLPGVNSGYISIFDLNGNFIRRLVSRNQLNAPWGIISAPSSFGYPAGSIMVANYGDGSIMVYDFMGKCLGPMRNLNNVPICIKGIRGLAVRNDLIREIGYTPGLADRIYWTSYEPGTQKSFMGTIFSRTLAKDRYYYSNHGLYKNVGY